jgi:ligand-binding SRPBCC domain-containing protein
MKTYRFKTALRLPRPRQEVFNFFADPKNLERITPAWLRFEMLTPPEVELAPGTLLDYRLRLRGIPLRWQSEIAVWDPPYRFVDRQTKGPYSFWVHEHTFIDLDGSTLVEDGVEYAVPAGWLFQRFLVAPDLERIFSYRRTSLQKLFTCDAPSGITT